MARVTNPESMKTRFAVMLLSGVVLILVGLLVLQGTLVPTEIFSAIAAWPLLIIELLPAIIIFAGISLVLLSGAAIKDLNSADPTEKLECFSSGRRLLVFFLSLIVYGSAAFTLATRGYSLYLPVVMSISIIGIAASLHQKKQDSILKVLALNKIDLATLTGLLFFASFILSRDLLSWHFSFIGDEYPFYEKAKFIATQADLNQLNIFSYSGVYGKFPIADSFYMALFLKLFGVSMKSWKMSCVVIHVATVGMVYGIARVLYGRVAGLVSGVCLAFSNYFLAFDKIGYNNTHICFTASLTMLLFVIAYRSASRPLFFLTGISCGLLTYSNWGGLLTLPIVGGIVLLLSMKKRSFRFAAITGATIFFGFAFAALPGLLSNSTESVRLISDRLNHGRSFGSVGFGGWSQALAQSIWSFWGPEGLCSHYVCLPILDVVTSSLLIAGGILSLRSARTAQSIIVLSWFFIGLVGVVSLSLTDFISITRLLYVLPPISILAGLSAQQVSRVLRPKALRMTIISGVASSVFVLNIQKLYILPSNVGSYSEIHVIIAELQATSAQNILYVHRGSHVLSWMESYLRSHLSPEKHLYFMSAEELRTRFKQGTLFSLVRQGKIIASLEDRGLLEEMLAAGEIPGPVTRVSGQFGGVVMTANDTASSLGLRRPENFYQLFKFWFDEVVYGDSEAVRMLRNGRG